MEGRILTLAQLFDAEACEDYTDPFQDKFGKEVLVTVEVAISQADDWAWDWAAEYLLHDNFHAYREAVRPFLKAHTTVLNPAETAHWEASRRALEAHAEFVRIFRAEHDEQMTLEAWEKAREVYREITAPTAEALYAVEEAENLKLNQAKARIFAELYIKEGEK